MSVPGAVTVVAALAGGTLLGVLGALLAIPVAAGLLLLYDEVLVGRETTRRLVGATIVFRPVRGLSSAWLERVLDCHLARNESLGHDVPEMPTCPLVPAGVTVNVRPVGTAFAVDVRAEGEAEAQEVLRRAQLLAAS